MPVYELICHECGEISEHFMGLDDNRVLIKCTGCAAKMTREKNKYYQGMRLQIVGDTCAGNNRLWDYYDPILQKKISSKRQRDDEMKRQGLTEWQPNPIDAKYMKEREYIKKQSRPGDKEAARERKALSKAATDEKRRAAVDRVFDRAEKSGALK